MPVKPTNYDEQYTGLLWGGATIGTVTGGDLSGTLPNPTVTGINGITVLGTPTDGQELVYSSASNAWIPETESGGGGGGGGAGGIAPAMTSFFLTGGDYTIASSSFVYVDSANAILNLTTGASRILIGVEASIVNLSGTIPDMCLEWELDGTKVSGCDNGMAQANAPNGYNANMSFTYITGVLSAGTHVLKLMARTTDGSSMKIEAKTTGGGNPLHGWAIEMAAFGDPMTSEGDLIYQHSGVATRLGLGANGQALLSNGTDPYWGTISTSGAAGAMQHAHITGEPFTGDGSTKTFVLANEADIYDVAAYVAGLRTDSTVDATGHTITFASAPANAAAIRVDYVAALT